jgi:hypothetical protein
MRRNALLGLIVIAIALLGGCTDKKPGDYAVLMTVFSHPVYHAQHGQMIKTATEEEAGWEDIYLVHEESATKVFRGPYESKSQAERAMKTTRKHYDAGGVPPFLRATVVYLPPDDLGPKQWRLINKTENVRYTLLVAEYFNEGGFEEREQYAIDYCRELREKGHEAFYFHDASRSYVTVGDFPEEAYQLRFVEATRDNRTGETVPVAKQVITDRKLDALTKDFPNRAINGQLVYRVETDIRTGEKIKRPEESYITEIPKKGDSF